MHIIHFITDLFIAAGTIDNNIEGQSIGFSGDFMWDQLPTMVQVTDTAFKNIKVKSPFLLTIRQAIDLGILVDQTLLPPDCSWFE